jgi:hypothetical protein
LDHVADIASGDIPATTTEMLTPESTFRAAPNVPSPLFNSTLMNNGAVGDYEVRLAVAVEVADGIGLHAPEGRHVADLQMLQGEHGLPGRPLPGALLALTSAQEHRTPSIERGKLRREYRLIRQPGGEASRPAVQLLRGS